MKALELHQAEGLRRLLPRLTLGHVLVPKPKGDVLLNCEEGEERVRLKDRIDVPLVGRGVGDVAPVEEDLSLRGFLEPCYEAKGGGLPAAGRAQHREELASDNVHIDAADGGDLGKALDEVDDLNLATCHKAGS